MNVKVPKPVLTPPATAPAAAGQPGHLERLISAAPRGVWPRVERWRDLSRYGER